MGEKSMKAGSRASSSLSRASIVKSIASSSQERKSLEWVDDLLQEEASKQELKSDYASDTWAKIVASELTMADVDKKIQEVEEELFGSKSKVSSRKDKKAKTKEVEEEVEEYEDEEEDSSEPKSFTFDMGRLDGHVFGLIKLLDNITFPGKPMPDAAGTKSVYTATKENMNRLGLQMVLNRVAVVFEYKNVKIPKESGAHGNTVVNITSDAKSNIWDKLKGMKISDALRTLAQRTDGVFGKELGIISGSLLLYPRHVILMLEAPELSLVDYFTQLYRSSLMERIVKGKVLFIMPQVLIRYFDDWSEIEAVPPERVGEISSLDQNKAKQLLGILGHKCAHLWKYLRKHKLTGLGRTCENLPTGILPEEVLIEFLLDSNLMRSFEQWLFELSSLEVNEEAADDAWPETDFTVPESAYKPDQYTESLGITVKSKQPPPGPTQEMDQFLTKNKKLYEQAESHASHKETKSDSTAKRKETTHSKEASRKDQARQPLTRMKITGKESKQQRDETDKSLKSRTSQWKIRKKT